MNTFKVMQMNMNPIKELIVTWISILGSHISNKRRESHEV